MSKDIRPDDEYPAADHGKESVTIGSDYVDQYLSDLFLAGILVSPGRATSFKTVERASKTGNTL